MKKVPKPTIYKYFIVGCSWNYIVRAKIYVNEAKKLAAENISNLYAQSEFLTNKGSWATYQDVQNGFPHDLINGRFIRNRIAIFRKIHPKQYITNLTYIR